MAEQNSRFDADTFDNTSSVPNLGGAGDNIDFDESLPANDKETSSIITDDDDEAAEDAQEDTI